MQWVEADLSRNKVDGPARERAHLHLSFRRVHPFYPLRLSIAFSVLLIQSHNVLIFSGYRANNVARLTSRLVNDKSLVAN